MNNYIVYDKVHCTSCEGKGRFNVGMGVPVECFTCEGKGTELKEVSLSSAMINIITKDTNVLDKITKLTWTRPKR